MSHWNEIEDLFEQAMALPSGERSSFLHSAASEPEIANQVLELLEADMRLSPQFMQTGFDVPPDEYVYEPGEWIDAWEIVAPIAHGGMGEVYKVKRSGDGFEQTCALKLTRDASPRLIERFLAERQILATLEHANIGRLIDGGATQSGHLYMVIEFVDGEKITDFAIARNLGLEARLELFKSLCRAVGFAHSRLVLHRDITPNNVLVTADGDVKLIDFGVASLADDGFSSAKAPMTRAYAAPEQIAGDTISVQTDVFALGRILSDLTEDLSQKSDKDLEAIIRMATADLPNGRYASVDGFIDDIERYRRGEPVNAREGGTNYHLSKFLKRRQLAVSGFSIAFLAMTAGLISTSILADRANRAARTAEAALIEAEKARIGEMFEARTLQGYRYGLQSLYGGDELTGDLIEPEQIDASLKKIVASSLEGARTGSLNDAFMIFAIGQNFMYRADFEAAAEILRPLSVLKTGDPALDVEIRSDLAKSLYETGRSEDALPLAREALAGRYELYDAESSGWIQDAATIAGITGANEDYQLLVDVLESEIDNFDFEQGDSSDLSWLYNQLGTALLQKKDYARVTAAFRKAFEFGRNQRVISLDDVSAATNLAQFEIYFEQNADAALSYLPDYLEVAGGEFGDDPLRLGFIHGLMAEAHLLKGNWDEARRHAETARDWLEPYPNFRGGWYYDVSLMLLKAQAVSGDIGTTAPSLPQIVERTEIDFDGDVPGILTCKILIANIFTNLASVKAARSSHADAQEFCRKQIEATDAAWLIVGTHFDVAERLLTE